MSKPSEFMMMMMMIMVMQFLCDVDLLLGTAVTQNVMNGK
jgi:hypothetical protein